MILRDDRRTGLGLGLGVAFALAVSVLVSVVSTSVAAAQSASDVEVRDQLIANQENLLNTYRCLYGVDVDVVPGGCSNPVTVTPGVAPPNPTQQDIDVRDGLIQNQEALLNVYRCRFNVDTQLVPGGCPDTPTEDTTEDTTDDGEDGAPTEDTTDDGEDGAPTEGTADDTDDGTPTEDTTDDGSGPGAPTYGDDVVDPDVPPTTLLGSAGDLTVKLHVCADPDLASLVSTSDIAATADAWNEQEAPFYSWQSSGQLNMRMEAGMILESRVLDDRAAVDRGDRGVNPFPGDCLSALSEQSGVIHHLLLYVEGHCGQTGGTAYRNRGLSSVCVASSWQGSRPLVDAFIEYFNIISHELDHNIGVAHEYYRPVGQTRVGIGENVRPMRTIGSIAAHPTVLMTRPPFSQALYPLYRCYEVEALGWPVGDDSPACVRMLPTAYTFSGERTADDRIRYEWVLVGHLSEPITGQTIRLRRWDSQADGAFGWTEVESYSLAADASSFILPSQPSGLYEVVLDLELSWAFGNVLWDSLRNPLAGEEVHQHRLAADELASISDIAVVRTDIKVAQRPVLKQVEFDLSWTSAQGASHYKISGYNRCSATVGSKGSDRDKVVEIERGGCEIEVTSPAAFLDEASGVLTEGDTYNIVIEACDPVAETRGTLIGCYVWATTTLEAERYEPASENAIRVGLYEESRAYTRFLPPCDLVTSTQEDCHVCDITVPGDCLVTGNGPAYLIEWDQRPEAAHYYLRFGECDATPSQCLAQGFSASQYQQLTTRDEVGEKIYVFFDYGQQYLLEVIVCPEGADPDQFDWMPCTPWVESRTTFTTLTRNN